MYIDKKEKHFLQTNLNYKAKSLAKQICTDVERENTPPFTRLIKKRISTDIKIHFDGQNLESLPKEMFSTYLEYLRQYAYYYCGKWYK